MPERSFWVYILASQRNGTLYVGVTGDLARRLWQHRNREGSGFVVRYGVTRLVYAESHAEAPAAIAREKQIKKWNRRWKLELIEKANPQWLDLYERLNG